MSVVKDLPWRTAQSLAERPSPQASGWFVFLMLLGISGYLYLNLFLLPNAPILLSGDQMFFWMNGQRMLHGERPYLDFFQFTPPGADVFYLGLFKAFGPRIWPLNFAVLVLGVVLCWLCFVIANQIMERHFAVLSALLFVTLIYTRLLNATHHYFSVLAVMGGDGCPDARSQPSKISNRGSIAGSSIILYSDTWRRSSSGDYSFPIKDCII
jgi:hypothetical protein